MTDARLPRWLWILIAVEILAFLVVGSLFAVVFAAFTPGSWSREEMAWILGCTIGPTAFAGAMAYLAQLMWRRDVPVAAALFAGLPVLVLLGLIAVLLGRVWL